MMEVHTNPAVADVDGVSTVVRVPENWDEVQLLLRQVGTELGIGLPEFQGWFWDALLQHEAGCSVCSVELLPRCHRGSALRHIFELSHRLRPAPGLERAYNRYYDELGGRSPGPVHRGVIQLLRDLRRLVIAPWNDDIKTMLAAASLVAGSLA